MTAIIDFDVTGADIGGLLVITLKQISDDRGTIREIFRRSAFEAAGVTEPRRRSRRSTSPRVAAARSVACTPSR